MLKSILVLIALAAMAAARKQRVTVKGQLFCPKNPDRVKDATIKLVDDDTGRDDNMGSTKPRSDGSFELSGTASDAFGGKIDPRLKIYHRCGVLTCKRRWKFEIPSKYIDKGTMDLGRMNLELGMEDEERKCLPA